MMSNRAASRRNFAVSPPWSTRRLVLKPCRVRKFFEAKKASEDEKVKAGFPVKESLMVVLTTVSVLVGVNTLLGSVNSFLKEGREEMRQEISELRQEMKQTSQTTAQLLNQVNSFQADLRGLQGGVDRLKTEADILLKDESR